MSKFLLFIAAFSIIGFGAHSQSITNVGNDFWIAFPPNLDGMAQHYLFISSDYSTSGTVFSAHPGVTQNFTVVPGTVTQLLIPGTVALSEGIENKGIRVTSLDPISLYGLSDRYTSTDAYLALPVNALGTDYRVMTYTGTIDPELGSGLSVVSIKNGTNITVYNHQSGMTENISLDEGETYHIRSTVPNGDLTGSRVQSNFPVAVYGSNPCAFVTTGCVANDYLVEQMFPYYAWGKNHITVPLAGRDNSGDIFRILSAETGTDILVNGTIVATLGEGEHFDMNLTGYNAINASKAVLLAQFAKGFTCSGLITGDPLMMLILPREQFLTHYTISTVAGFDTNWVNLVAPEEALGTIYRDGFLIPDAAFLPVGTTGYYGAQLQITEGSHTFTGGYPFGLFVYGWATWDSYGYPAGGSMASVALVDSIALSPDTIYGQLNVTLACLTARVLDNLGNPVEGVLVTFNISGLSPMVGTVYTDSTGNAQYCYSRFGTIPGTDEVYAEAFGVLSDTSIVIWDYIPPCTNPASGGTIGPDQTSCGTLSPASIPSVSLPSGYSGDLEFRWQVSTSGPATGFSDIPGSDSSSLVLDSVSQTSWFRRISRVDCMPDWSGADTSNVTMVTVNPELPVSVIITAADPDICPGDTITCLAATQNKGAAPLFAWRVNGIVTGPNDSVFSYVPADGDLISCILTSSDLCTQNNPDTSNTIIVNLLDKPVVTFIPCFDTVTMTNAKPFRLKGGIPIGGTYSGAGVSGVPDFFFDPSISGPGTHEITYRYTNNSGCKDSSEASVVVLASSIFTCGSTLTDARDNAFYSTIQIGTQCWMAENLHYGTFISYTVPQMDNCVPEKYANSATYQWNELMQYEDIEEVQGLCPPGWHVPSEADWDELFSFFQGSSMAGSPLRYTGFSGFNALLPGALFFNRGWYYTNFVTFFWSSTSHGPYKAWAHGLNEENSSVSLYPAFRSNALSVRCVRD